MMNRRGFLGLLGAAAAVPLVAGLVRVLPEPPPCPKPAPRAMEFSHTADAMRYGSIIELMEARIRKAEIAMANNIAACMYGA